MTIAPLPNFADDVGPVDFALGVLEDIASEPGRGGSGSASSFEGRLESVLIGLTSLLARGEFCKLLLRRRWRTFGGRGTSLRRSTPAVGVTDAFFAEAGCAGDSRLIGSGFLNDPDFAFSGAFAASLGVAIGAEASFFALGGSNEVGVFVCLGCQKLHYAHVA